MSGDTPLARWVDFLETLAPDTLDRLDALTTDGVRFADPFNDVSGRAAVRAVFAHTLDTCRDVRFTVSASAMDGDVGLLRWRFQARVAVVGDLDVTGMSTVHLGPGGRVAAHVDYWDSAGPVLARLPLVGGVVRLILRRLAVPAAGRRC
ncbi:limonene-1,2-epoxide hydrolase [Azospirillum fermentarium]|uniref:nuclear transport factor 2 family protein n=1 Tax=Azospirillum fermentarium TaxID=1233114 RepID=UPI002227AAC7|nr:nuclear transport factor 2 family protein [Azospirillum fermentarium]MCW2247427.1 limonene-1,2-epoxide hydrolase [Azospirillum fermentarium]